MQCPALRNWINCGRKSETRRMMGRRGVMAKEAKSAATPQTTEQVGEKSLLDQIVETGRVGTDPASRERGKNLVKEFISQVLEGSVTVSKDTEAMINARIAQIDHLLSIRS